MTNREIFVSHLLRVLEYDLEEQLPQKLPQDKMLDKSLGIINATINHILRGMNDVNKDGKGFDDSFNNR